MQPPPPAEDVPPPVVPPPASMPLGPPLPGDPQKMSQMLMTNMMNLMMRLTRPEKHVQSNEQDMTLQPLRTLYVNNLNDRVKIPKLREQLRAKFSPYGEIENILTMKSFWRRGQAFVSFKTQEAATKALEALQGQMLEGKPMRVNYARKESDCLHKGDEAVTSRERGAKKPRAIRERESLLQEQFLQLQQQMTAFQQQGFAAPIMEPVTKEEPEVETPGTDENRKRKVFSLSLKGPQEDPKKRREAPAPPALPHKTLFLENLPPDVQESELTAIFGSMDGFERVRIAVRNCGFVDFKTIPQASAALQIAVGKEIREGFQVCATFARR
eukprot:Protomagalhaensia_sp_Gyna_25__396@NODE_1188_length_2084_cov_109_883619_g944_i0_p1_GENE_NODE_1188_length_2084_cov_109_883619_g944_i0NODE_1188_length_2084_cov_109_883619_g944_i0_p1_ORF_typecomplete_len327_score71_75RRM_1/PF00076_22/4_1e14RRM_1/PF00076_22/1_8e08RRM_5/PF13893_6/1_3e14RRM_5/PF13893_6/0_098RRM_occluded/PF16842_5/5_4e05RRM_occluded/PF16842_5/8_5DUF4523/PF15023_6/3e06DUF4523/PF15023_6/2_3e03Limkainb1/PF11608_8/7_4e06Limkainb1/PF11608_8/1_2e03RRM_Rrp7/PF17799_1/1_9e02RRM_Rrp7/PF17799_1/3